MWSHQTIEPKTISSVCDEIINENEKTKTLSLKAAVNR